MKKRRPTTDARIRALQRRVLILERYCDGMLRMCQLELDTRVKAVERHVAADQKAAKR